MTYNRRRKHPSQKNASRRIYTPAPGIFSPKNQEEAERKIRQLEQQYQEVSKQLQILQIITDTALSHLTLDDLFREVLSRISEIMVADTIAILLLTEDGKNLVVRAAKGLEEEIEQEMYIPIGRGFAGRIAAERRPMIVHDISTVEIVSPILRENVRSLMGAPMIVDNRVIGVIHVGMKHTHLFTEHDLQLFQRVADRIAHAIDHALLYQAEKQARLVAARHASQLEAIFESMTDVISVYDSNGRLLQINQAGHEMYFAGDTASYMAQPIYESAADFHVRDEHGQLLPTERWPVYRLLQGEVITGSDAIDVIFDTPDGRQVQLSTSGAPIRDQDGNIIGVVAISHDVTERRRNERRLREALHALIAMAEALMQPSQIDGINTTSNIELVEQTIARLISNVLTCKHVGVAAIETQTSLIYPVIATGFSQHREEHWFNSISLSLSPLLDRLLGPAINSRLRTNETLFLESLEPPLQNTSDLYGVRALLAVPVLADRNLVGVLYADVEKLEHSYSSEEMALIEAMTKFSVLAIEREHREKQSRHLLNALQHANEQLEQASTMQRNFMSIIGHEIRTPLAGIQGFSELICRRDWSMEEIKDFATDIFSDAKRLNRIVSEFLDLERMRAGHMSLNVKTVNLNAILREASARAQATTQKHTLSLQLNEQVPPLQGDEDKLAQVMVNLLSNAVKYSPNGGTLLVKSQLEEQSVHVQVQDHGTGIPAAALEKLFTPFYRVESTSSRYIQGTGLGLPIVKEIIAMHNGRVWVESVLGQGSTFHFSLPFSPTP